MMAPKFIFVSATKPSKWRRALSWMSTVIDALVIVACYYLNHHFLGDNGWVGFLLFLLALYTMFAFVTLTSAASVWKTEEQAWVYLEGRRRRAEAERLN